MRNDTSDHRKYQNTLSAILRNKDYLPHDDSGFRGFIADMKSALDVGRTITPKMDSAIKRIVKKYNEWKDPGQMIIRSMGRDRIFGKLNQLRSKLQKANYTNAYMGDTELFLNSIEDQARRKGTLSMGQMQALNRMYKKFNKRIEKAQEIVFP